MTGSSKLIPRAPGFALTAAEKDSLNDLRERFLGDPIGTDLSVLRPVIARSWQRSALFKVSPEKKIMAAMGDPQIDEQFLRAAEPALGELERLCVDTHGCVSLTDSMGTITVFRGEPSMVRWADKIFPTLGGCMSEDIVGTNSDGTAIEEGSAVQVWGGEHFNEALQDSYCTSVPIRDPLRRSIRGVLSLTLPERIAADLDPRSVLLIVQGAAADITHALAARLAAREQALLSEYLCEVRKRGADAVVAMDEHTTIASRGAMQLLEESDYAVLAGYAREAARLDRPMEHEILCSSETVLQFQARPVSAGDASAGSVMRLRKFRPQPSRASSSLPVSEQEHFPDFIGESLALRRALEAAGAAASRGIAACMVGEAGTGKRRLAEAIAGRFAEQVSVYDCTADGTDAPNPDELETELGEGRAVILVHADALAADLREGLTKLLARLEQPHILLTLTKLTDEMQPLISALRGVEIHMPSLRTRREDIPLLVKHFLGSLENPRRAAPRLLETLVSAEWPGNVAQLKEVVEAAALQSAGREVRLEDLTELHRRALARSRLSPLQKAELEQIRQVLAEANGNRLRAAEILRIGRSTLYRKMDFYTSRGFDLGLIS